MYFILTGILCLHSGPKEENTGIILTCCKKRLNPKAGASSEATEGLPGPGAFLTCHFSATILKVILCFRLLFLFISFSRS